MDQQGHHKQGDANLLFGVVLFVVAVGLMAALRQLF